MVTPVRRSLVLATLVFGLALNGAPPHAAVPASDRRANVIHHLRIDIHRLNV